MKKYSSKNAVASICSQLRKETIEPAMQEAKQIIDNARLEEKKILEEAHRKKNRLLEEAQIECTKKQKALEASLKISTQQVMDTLKQQIEKSLFHPAIDALFSQEFDDPQLLAKLIDGVAKGLEKEGMEANFEVFITKSVSKQKILEALMSKVKKRLCKETLHPLPFSKGVQLKLQKQGFTIDLTKESLRELLAKFMRNEFKELIFQNPS